MSATIAPKACSIRQLVQERGEAQLNDGRQGEGGTLASVKQHYTPWLVALQDFYC